jgi:RNA polymerase sigma factor (TIGR02999 family)
MNPNDSPPGPQMTQMNDINHLLDTFQKGDPIAGEKLFVAVYSELRRLASAKMSREAPGQTLQPTALVHEAWLCLGGDGQRWENRAHFFGAAAEAMRRILIDRARRKLAARHGGGQHLLDVSEIDIAAPAKDDELLAVHEALDQLAAHDPQKAELVKLRYFAGLTIAETAEVLGVSVPTAKRHWAYARAWLYRAISG